jgi:hypothetical protein
VDNFSAPPKKTAGRVKMRSLRSQDFYRGLSAPSGLWPFTPEDIFKTMMGAQADCWLTLPKKLGGREEKRA